MSSGGAVAESIPDGVIGILHDFNSSSAAKACG
jgi:hypothetical protein